MVDNLTVKKIWVNSSVIKIPRTVNYMPPKSMIHYIDKLGTWYETFPIPLSLVGENVNLVVKYIPSLIKKDENNIMFNVIQEFLPNHIKGGWIPIDSKKRETMYSDTYQKLKRYIEPIKTQNKKSKSNS